MTSNGSTSHFSTRFAVPPRLLTIINTSSGTPQKIYATVIAPCGMEIRTTKMQWMAPNIGYYDTSGQSCLKSEVNELESGLQSRRLRIRLQEPRLLMVTR